MTATDHVKSFYREWCQTQLFAFTTSVALRWSSWHTRPQCSGQSLLNNGNVCSRVALIQLLQLSQSGGKQWLLVDGCGCCYSGCRFFDVIVMHGSTPNDDAWTGHQLFALQWKRNSALAAMCMWIKRKSATVEISWQNTGIPCQCNQRIHFQLFDLTFLKCYRRSKNWFA